MTTSGSSSTSIDYDRLASLVADVHTKRLFDSMNVFVFIEPWSGHGKRRLYLRGSDGATWGYKDLATSEVAVLDAGDPKVVRAILSKASGGALDLNPRDIPKVPAAGAGLATLSRVTRSWSNFFIAQTWRRGTHHRLYVNHAIPGDAVYRLGHVDLVAAAFHPVSDQPLGKDLAPPKRYLEVVLSRYVGSRPRP